MLSNVIYTMLRVFFQIDFLYSIKFNFRNSEFFTQSLTTQIKVCLYEFAFHKETENDLAIN